MEVPMLDDLELARILPVATQHCVAFELDFGYHPCPYTHLPAESQARSGDS